MQISVFVYQDDGALLLLKITIQTWLKAPKLLWHEKIFIGKGKYGYNELYKYT